MYNNLKEWYVYGGRAVVFRVLSIFWLLSSGICCIGFIVFLFLKGIPLLLRFWYLLEWVIGFFVTLTISAFLKGESELS